MLAIFVLSFQFIPSGIVLAESTVQEQSIQDNDRIELPNDTVTLNVGNIFSPENYATAFRGDQEIPYGDGEFTAIFNDVDTSKAGTYTITYRLENVMAGTFIDKTMTVIVQDNDRIELPNDTVTLNVGDIFSPENYATAFRGDQEIPYGDGEFTAIFNDVDTSKAGTYTITYRLENVMAGTFIDKTMTVIVQDNDRIELPNDTVTLNVGDIFSPENYATAFRGDQEIPYGDGEFTAIFNDVDTSKAGTYTITYRLENVMAGTFIDKTMTVIVQDNDRIELPNDTVTLNVGDIFSPENYATAFRGDQEIPYGDGEFTAIFNDVDTSKAGTYTITYRLENVMAGTFIDKTMTVIVQDSILGADVTIHYQDTEGNTIAPDVVKSGNIGDPYSFEQLTIDGYTFKEVNGNPNGTFTDTAQTVTYVYTKNTINQPLEPTKPSESYTKPVVKAKTINSASTTATLPQTGETNSPLLTDVGAMILLASGAYILTFKRKKSN